MFYQRLPNADQEFVMMRGISHASFQQKNYMMVHHILHAFFIQPAPVNTGEQAAGREAALRYALG